MDFILSLIPQLSVIISVIVSVCSALITIFLFIPGASPEKELQAIVDFLSKYSKK